MKSVLIFLNFQFLNWCFIYCMIIVCLLFTGTSAPPPTPGRPLRGQTLTAVRGSSRSWVMRGMSSTGNPRSLSAPHKPSSPSRKLGHRRSPPLSCFCRRYKQHFICTVGHDFIFLVIKHVTYMFISISFGLFLQKVQATF